MRKFTFIAALLLLAGTVFGANISYKLSMPEPHTHYFEVEMTIASPNTATVDLKLPVWAPGSYLVREFAKSVEAVKAVNSTGRELSVNKIDKNTWRVDAGKAKKVVCTYRVYAYELSVRTSFVDAEHGYINGTSVFMYMKGQKDVPVTLDIVPNPNWKKITTSLESNGGQWSFKAPNYDFFVDCPIEMGNHHTFSFTAAGVPHEVAMFGEGNYDEEKLKKDMAAVVEACTDVFGVNPNKRYVFIIHNLGKGGGGLEHTNSTSLQVSRWGYEPEGRYLGFLSLVAHEYFHLWNVKRIRPKELGPFDYDHECHTPLLWVMEGFTSYYDEYLLMRAGFYDEDKMLSRLASSIGTIENQPGGKVISVAEASFDAWIKAYRPNENSYNTTISYYTKGAMCAFALDLEIREANAGTKSLDDLLQYLYKEYYEKRKRGFTADEFQAAAEKIAGKSLKDFFDKYINGTETIPFDTYLGFGGWERTNTNANSNVPTLGINLGEDDDGRLMIKRVVRGTAGYQDGINANDELLAINGFRVRTQKAVNQLVEMEAPGTAIDVMVARDGKIMTLKVTLQAKNTVRYTIKPMEKLTPQQEKVHASWMGQ